MKHFKLPHVPVSYTKREEMNYEDVKFVCYLLTRRVELSAGKHTQSGIRIQLGLPVSCTGHGSAPDRAGVRQLQFPLPGFEALTFLGTQILEPLERTSHIIQGQSSVQKKAAATG